MVHSVARRTREIAVRMTIRAKPADISRTLLRDSANLTLAGSAIAIFVAASVRTPLAMFLVPGLRSGDPGNFAVVLAVMIATGLAAWWIPARRAAGIDPNATMRED